MEKGIGLLARSPGELGLFGWPSASSGSDQIAAFWHHAPPEQKEGYRCMSYLLNNGLHVPREWPANRFHLAFSCTFWSFLFSHGPFGHFAVFLPLPLSLTFRKGTPFLLNRLLKKKKENKGKTAQQWPFYLSAGLGFLGLVSQSKTKQPAFLRS